MGGLLSALLYIVVISTLMEKVESYTDIYELVHKCNQPIKEIHDGQSYLVLYAREVLPDNHCRLSFISKDDKVKVCVKTNFFSIMDCRIKLNYHRTFGFKDKSYSCNDSSPQEFCAEKKDTLYISLENASLYTNANIKLVVTASKPDSLLWLIGVAVGVVVASFILYSVCKQRVLDFCKKRKANVNSTTQSQVTPNSSNPTQSGSSNTPKSKTPKPKAAAAAAKKTSTPKPATKKQSDPKLLTSGASSSQTAETIPESQQPQLPLIPMPSVMQTEPTPSPLSAEVSTPQSPIQVQVTPQPVVSDTDLFPPATKEQKSPPDEFEVAIQMDQNENNGRQLPTQREAPEYHTLFVSPPPYTERIEQ